MRQVTSWIVWSLGTTLAAGAPWSGAVGLGQPNARADVAAVQRLLNQLPIEQGGSDPLLTVDGQFGPATASAIRRFHDVLKTTLAREKAMLDPASPAGKQLFALREAQPISRRIVAVARGEAAFWRNRQRKETEAAVGERLREYWGAVGRAPTLTELADPAFQDKNPWSAAFISYVMKEAGAGAEFHYAAAHWQYVAAAKKNRLAGRPTLFVAYPMAEQAPALGDIVVKRRAGSNATYDNIEKGHLTHGDIVVDVAAGEIATIGGNVAQSVAVTKVKLDAKGKVSDERYFAIVKIHDGAARPR